VAQPQLFAGQAATAVPGSKDQPPAGPPRKRRVSIGFIIQEMWNARYLLMQFARRDLTVRYSQAIMGFAWALLMPVLIVCSGLIFRLVVSVLSGGAIDHAGAAALAVKALPWAFFSGAISLSSQSIVAHANLIAKVYFPRETLPVASVLAQGVDALVGAACITIAMPFLGVTPHWSLLWVPLLVLLMLSFTIGCALLLSCANLFFRDVKYIVQVVLNFGVFATPVFFEPQLLGVTGAKVMLALPLTPFIQGLDLAAVRGHNLLEPLFVMTGAHSIQVWSPWLLAYATALAIVTPLLGLRVFRSASSRFAEMA
jgi:ABC-type polysaccharide/polyol phosphate export permease